MENLRLLYDFDIKQITLDKYGNECFAFELLEESWQRADLNIDLTTSVLKYLHQSQESFLTAHYAGKAGKSVTKNLTPSRGFISGVGEASVHPTGFKLHPLWGIPFIPASGWQGVIRHWFLRMAYLPAFEAEIKKENIKKENIEKENIEKELEKFAEKDPAFVYLFGNTDQKGNITFLDAYPKELKIDNFKITGKTPHHKNYYTGNGNVSPIDTENPVPIQMLVVKGVTFVLRMANEGKYGMANEGKYGDWKTAKKDSILDKAKKSDDPLTLLEEQLPFIFLYFGVGSNTHNGYGKGEINDDTSQPTNP